MYFTKSTSNFRGWFHLEADGLIRSGAVANDFIVTIVTANDLGSYIPFVTESVQKPGLYYFDIPTSFLIASGYGHYGISIQTIIDEFPTLATCQSHVLHVRQNDLDTLSSSLWSTPAANFNVTGTMGWLENRTTNIDVAVSSRAVAGDAMSLTSAALAQIISGVWTISGSNFTTSGSTGWINNKLLRISSSIEDIRNVEFGRWLITGSQQIMYNNAGIELVRFNLLKSDGSAFTHDSNAVVERLPTGSV